MSEDTATETAQLTGQNPRWTVQYRAEHAGRKHANQLLLRSGCGLGRNREFVAPPRCWRWQARLAWRKPQHPGPAPRTSTARLRGGSGPTSCDLWSLESKTTQDSVIVDGSVTQNVGEFSPWPPSTSSTTGAEFVAGDRAMLGPVSHYEADNTLKAAIQGHHRLLPTFLPWQTRHACPLLRSRPRRAMETYKGWGYEVVLPRHNLDGRSQASSWTTGRRPSIRAGRIIDRVWARTHRNLTGDPAAHTRPCQRVRQPSWWQRFMRHRGGAGTRSGLRPWEGALIPAGDTATAGYSNLFFPGFEFRRFLRTIRSSTTSGCSGPTGRVAGQQDRQLQHQHRDGLRPDGGRLGAGH